MRLDTIDVAVNLIRRGELIIFPTDTLYALGADPNNEQAINKVFQFKVRSRNQALPVLLSKIEQLAAWVDQGYLISTGLMSTLWDLAASFWPGALTIVVKKAMGVSNLLTANQDNIALRIPNHPLALELLDAFGRGIIGTSANKSGSFNTVDPKEIIKTFGKDIYVLANDPPMLGEGSTIVALTEAGARILREGAISAEQIQRVVKVIK